MAYQCALAALMTHGACLLFVSSPRFWTRPWGVEKRGRRISVGLSWGPATAIVKPKTSNYSGETGPAARFSLIKGRQRKKRKAAWRSVIDTMVSRNDKWWKLWLIRRWSSLFDWRDLNHRIYAIILKKLDRWLSHLVASHFIYFYFFGYFSWIIYLWIS